MNSISDQFPVNHFSYLFTFTSVLLCVGQTALLLLHHLRGGRHALSTQRRGGSRVRIILHVKKRILASPGVLLQGAPPVRLRPLLLRRVRLGAWLRREGGRLRRVRRRRRVLPAEERHLVPADLPRRVPAGAVAAGGGQERATGRGGAVERYGSFGKQQFHSSCRSKRRQPLRHPSSQLELQSAVAR